jgi:cysteinyl-tRNA synthetase
VQLKLYNALTRDFNLLVPQKEDKRISLYCCGVTVYDHCHLGHGRSVFVIYDVLVRLLREQGYDVLAVRNITDLDDKIIHKAHSQQTSCDLITQQYIQSMRIVMEQLHCQHPDQEPLATESIDTIIDMIQTLIQQGHAYVVDGEVFFEISTFSEYGKLSGQKLEELVHGARVAESTEKRHAGDFTLWKPSKEGEPAWRSPWGLGRPGWHIECSAMIENVFHDTIDIHLGGADLKFPHHENEIAQSEACFKRPLARHWMHVGFVTVDDIKMSKSLGNFHYLHDVLKELGSNVLRYFYLTTHYRQPLAFTKEKVEQAERSWNSLNRALAHWLPSIHHDVVDQTVYNELMDALCDDLNTPELLARIYKHVKRLESCNTQQAEAIASTLIGWMDRVLGLAVRSEEIEREVLPVAVQELLNQRALARQQKNFELADKLRDAISALGYQVIDTAEGQKLLAV